MNKIVVLFFLTLISFVSFSQALSADEIKTLKAEMKQLTPEQYKKLKTDLDESLAKNIKLEEEVEKLKLEEDQLNSDISKLKDENNLLKQQVAELSKAKNQTAPKSDSAAVKSAKYDNYSIAKSKGIVYKVQIGAYHGIDLREYAKANQNLNFELGEDGTIKYTLGEFKDYWEADKFKQYLRKMGVKDAWIVTYKDGKRVTMKDAREGVL